MNFEEYKAGMLSALSASGVPFYCDSNLIAINRSMHFLKDEDYVRAFKASLKDSEEQRHLWKQHTLCWAIRQACQLPEGDLVECGVRKGFSAGVATQYLNFSTVSKHYYLYDTFSGVPERYNATGKNEFSDAQYDQVVNRFKDYANIHVLKGTLPAILHEQGPVKIAFAHLDLAHGQAEFDTLKSIYNKIVAGGIVVISGYGWYHEIPELIKNDPVLSPHAKDILEIPTGQGLLIKRRPV